MRLIFLLCVLLLLVPMVEAAPVDTIINECWRGNDHSGMNRCVFNRAANARENLGTIENAVRAAIATSHEDAAYLKSVQERFEASVKSYRKYREDQCQLRTEFAVKGNGAAGIKLACEAELDTQRAEQLKAGIEWLR